MTNFILASLSPRRQELLQLCGYPFEIITVPVDENSVTDPDPIQNSVQTALLKAKALSDKLIISPKPQSIIIAADTIVSVDGQMMGKPGSTAEAHHMLTLLRGRSHQVHTGVSIIDLESKREVHGHHTAKVTMRSYSDQQIIEYIATGDPLDKAGAYAIQHPQFQPVAQLEGCFLGVMGLSICHLLQLLSQMDVPVIANMTLLNAAHQHYHCPLFDKIAQKHS